MRHRVGHAGDGPQKRGETFQNPGTNVERAQCSCTAPDAGAVYQPIERVKSSCPEHTIPLARSFRNCLGSRVGMSQAIPCLTPI